MANAAEIADLITAGIQGRQSGEDTDFYTGTIQSWDNLSGTNTVRMQGTTLVNLPAYQLGIGLAYQPGDVVLIMRKGSQYQIMSKLGKPSTYKSTTGSAPDYQTIAGGTITTPGGWTDVPGGPLSITARIGQHCMVSFGISYLATNNATIEGSIEVDTWAAGSFLGQAFRAGNNNLANGGPTINSAPSKTLYFYNNTALPSGYFRAGIRTFTFKVRLTLHNNGTGADVGQPWISIIPFG